VFAVLVPGWRLLTFRALHFGQAETFSPETIRTSSRFAEWVSIAGTEWNLYVATHDMSLSTRSERAAIERELERDYKPEFNSPLPANPSEVRADLRTLLLARAMRTNL
jgi:hypothetical protein